MPEQTASARYIDGLQFTQSEQSLSGSFVIKDLSRLRESVASDAGEIQFHIKGKQPKLGKPVLEIDITGRVELQCQRCLQNLTHGLDIHSRLALVKKESALPATEEEPEDVDTIVSSPEMNVAQMVEEEILLSLPMIPRHDACEMATDSKPQASETKLAGLATLKKQSL